MLVSTPKSSRCLLQLPSLKLIYALEKEIPSDSYWKPSFSGAMLVLGSARPFIIFHHPFQRPPPPPWYNHLLHVGWDACSSGFSNGMRQFRWEASSYQKHKNLLGSGLFHVVSYSILLNLSLQKHDNYKHKYVKMFIYMYTYMYIYIHIYTYIYIYTYM